MGHCRIRYTAPAQINNNSNKKSSPILNLRILERQFNLKSGLFLFIVISLPCIHGKLTLSKDCGEIVCSAHNYCSQLDHSCRPCQWTCDPALGNYDKEVCEKDCQDYLHDLWYLRKSENDSAAKYPQDEVYMDLYYKMQDDLRLLKILIGVVIILSTLVMLALFAIMIYFKRLRNKLALKRLNAGLSPKSKSKISDLPVIYSNNKILSLPFPDIHGPPSHISSSINNNISHGSSPDLVSRTSLTNRNYNGISLEKQQMGILNPSASFNFSPQGKQSKLRKEPSESTLPEYQSFDNPALVPSPIHVHM